MEYEERYELNTNKLIEDFLLDNSRYEVIIRGKKLSIHDNKRNHDVIEMRFDDTNKIEIQAKIEGICESLNNGEIIIR